MIDLEAQYPGRVTASSAEYPSGSSKNETVPGALDGTPAEQARSNDVFGFFQAIIRSAGLAVSGSSETALVSQLLKGMQVLATAGNNFLGGGAADAYTFTPNTNMQGPDAYVTGMTVSGSIAATNLTASPTLDVNGLGPKTIVGVSAGELVGGTVYTFRYDGVAFRAVGVDSIASGALLAANNLSDVNDADTALANLNGLSKTTATKQDVASMVEFANTVGFGVDPQTWSASGAAVEVGEEGALFGFDSGPLNIHRNLYLDSGGTYRHKNTGPAWLRQYSGTTVDLYYAVSASAGDPAALTLVSRILTTGQFRGPSSPETGSKGWSWNDTGIAIPATETTGRDDILLAYQLGNAVLGMQLSGSYGEIRSYRAGGGIRIMDLSNNPLFLVDNDTGNLRAYNYSTGWMRSDSFGQLTSEEIFETLISSRNTTGTWSITGLEVGKPLLLTMDVASGNNNDFVYRVTSGTADNDAAGQYNLGENAGYLSSKTDVLRPTATTVVIEVLAVGGNAPTCKAYQ